MPLLRQSDNVGAAVGKWSPVGTRSALFWLRFRSLGPMQRHGEIALGGEVLQGGEIVGG